MRTRVGAGSKPCRRPCLYRTWQDFDWARGRDRSSYRRGPAPQSARHFCSHLDECGGLSQASSWQATTMRWQGIDGRSKPTGIIRTLIFRSPPPLRISVEVMRRAPQSRLASRLTRPTSLSHARATRTARSDDPTYLAQLEPIFEGMRKAGLPE